MQAVVRELILRGPTPIGYEGKEIKHICAAMTGTESDLWLGNLRACEQMIEKRAEGLALVFLLFISLYFCYVCTCLCTVVVTEKLRRRVAAPPFRLPPPRQA